MNIGLLDITSKKDSLTSVFREIKYNGNLELKNPYHAKLFVLDIDSNEFSYSSLHKCLLKNIGAYVFSRAKIQQFKEEDCTETISREATNYLRTVSNPKDKGAGGELGEILLYLFLEQVLDAPKLLSKVELKSSPNQYIYGSDGVHLHSGKTEAQEPFYQLVLGEAKIKGDLKDAVKEAFNSIKKVKLDNSADINLVESNLFSESFDSDTLEFIKSLIIPSKRKLDISVDKAFGIFLGYTPILDSNLSNSEFRLHTQEQIQKDIENIIPVINKQMTLNGLQHNSIYIYFVPFNNAKEDRVQIMKKLKGES